MIDEKVDNKSLQAICDISDKAGLEAVKSLDVEPMIVYQPKSLFSDEVDYTKPIEYVEDGPCGFAWVSVKPANKGNTRLGKAERADLECSGFFKNEYEKTYQLWISQFNQSIQKKQAYARSFAKVLRDHGYNAIPGSRLD